MQPNPMRTIMLCVENDDDLLSLLQTVLLTNGYAVIAADDGFKVLNQMSGRRVDAVVLSSLMADSTVPLEMKRVRPQTPVIMFSESPDIPSSTLAYVDVIVVGRESLYLFLSALRRLLQPESQQVRIHTRHRVQFPFGGAPL